MTSKDPLLQPFTLKHLTLKNRLMITSHEPNYADDGMPGERYRLYHAERAKGGVALTMTAGSAVVSRDSPPSFGNLHAYDDRIVEHMARLAEACHEHGTAVMIQLTHLGRRTGWNHSDWLPALSASPLREPSHRAFPKQAEDWDIARIIGDYAAAAQRMKQSGIDGIEFEAYGHLMDSFWSPVTNWREDAYNGDLDRRLKFTFDVLDAVRAAVGPDFIVGIRMVADEDRPGGLTRDDGIAIAEKLAASGQIDFLNIIRGHIDTDPALANVIPVMGMASAPHLDFAGEVRQATRFPVFHAAKIADVATARHAIAEGKLDMVGMTRAHIAEPHIARLVAQGREQEIRPCVGATYCLDRIYEGREALCIHNPSTGREASLPHDIAPSDAPGKRVVVVGAGPAGLEAARVSAARGQRVTVFEAASDAGGQVRLAARHRDRADLAGIIDWRLDRLTDAGAEIRFNTYAEADEVLGLNPDIVIIATGGVPNTSLIREGEALVTTTWDILSGDVRPGADVLLYDDNGGHPGLQAADVIAQSGSKLEIVTPERFFAPEIGGLNHVSYARKFQENGVAITINTRVGAVARDGNRLKATLVSDYTGGVIATRLVDQVVVEHGTEPLDELYFDLKPLSSNLGAVDYDALIAGRVQQIRADPDGTFQLFRIGDAVSSRNIHAAIYDALRLCRVC